MQPIILAVVVILSILLGIILAIYLHPDRRALRERNAQLEEATVQIDSLRLQLQERGGELAREVAEKARLQGRIGMLEEQVAKGVKLQEEVVALGTENASQKERIANLEQEVAKGAKLEDEVKSLGNANAELRERLRQEGEQRKTLREESEKSFRELASAILDEKSRSFKQTNEERLGEILNPFKEEVQGLRKKIDECYTNERSEVLALEKSLKELTELNNTISREARELTDALRGNSKVQGDWGEMILKQILEKSGLEEGVNFTIQATTNADGSKIVGEESNQLRPDVIFHLPEGKNIIIDSKVSLTAYVKYVNATSDEEREAALSAHLASVQSHVKELTTKQYQRYVTDAADFVMMFIPNEGAYMAAMNADTLLWQRAYDQHVVIISPTHLISVLKLMYQLWTRDKQTKNALLIAEETGKLYDKLCGFVADLESVGAAIHKADEKYKDAFGKLSTGRGNLIKKAEDIRALGVRTAKRLPSSVVENSAELTAITDGEE